MAQIQFLTYYIVLDDPALVAEYQQTQWIPAVTVPGPIPLGVINRAPGGSGAQVEFDAPWVGAEPVGADAPYIWSPWVKEGATNPFPVDVATFTRKTGGFFGIGGTTTRYYWMGQFVSPPATVPAGSPTGAAPFAMPLRRWIDGLDFPGGATTGTPEGAGSSNAGNNFSRDASRTVDGLGFALRGQNQTHLRTVDFYAAGAPANQQYSWERVTVRPRAWPTASTRFWLLESTTPAASPQHIDLHILPSGQIAIYLNTGSTSLLAVTAAPLTLNEWHKLDILLRYHDPNPATDSNLELWVNGVQVLAPGFTSGAPLGQAYRHMRSSLGSASNNGLHIDYDDWFNSEWPAHKLATAWASGTDYAIGADVSHSSVYYEAVAASGPSNGGNVTPGTNAAVWAPRVPSLDWQNGTHMQMVRPTGFAGTHNAGAWTGDWRLLLQNPAQGASIGVVTSSTASAELAVTTDVEHAVDRHPAPTLGAGAWIVFADLQKAVSGDSVGSLGYNATLVAQVESTTYTYGEAVHRGGGQPAALASLDLRYVTGATTTGARNVRAMGATVELIGVWGPEDNIDADLEVEPAGALGPHNAPYPRTAWAMQGAHAPTAPYVVQAGTYVGNGTGQDITLRVPASWIWIRPASAGSATARWFSSMVVPHTGATVGGEGDVLVQAAMDETYVAADAEDTQQIRALFRVAGNDAASNASGVTFQYIAVCDPGARFVLNGSISLPTSGAGTATLVDPDFTPEYGFVQGEAPASAAGGTSGTWVKGIGHATAAASPLHATEVATLITFGPGTLALEAALGSTSYPHLAYSLWRRDDGSDDPGLSKVLLLTSYTGDGAASRTIGLPPTGLRPLFAIITPHNGQSYYRDPAHTTNTSATYSGSSSTTAITGGGIDSITIGTTLNTNGIVYDVFVIPGSATAGNGGWSVNGEFIPVEADTAPGGQWAEFPGEPIEEDEEEPEPETPTAPGDITTDLATACVSHTTRVVNLALSRIGISRPVANLATEVSEAATQARLHYGADVETCLEDFPWDFATRYATLVLVGGTEDVPVNADWQYSYRAPTDMLQARRIAGQLLEGRGYDPNPILFRQGTDATAGLIFSNASNADEDLVLEYTYRPSCAATAGSAKFRSALAWKLAASLALPLARDREKAAFCQTMYGLEIEDAKVNAANRQQQAKGGDAEWITGRS